MSIKNSIPNFLTSLNLFFGCLAIVASFNENALWAAYFVGIAAIFDFFDGFAARALGASSAIGKELDSLADMVTFGLVPGVIMFKLIGISIIYFGLHETISMDTREMLNMLPYLGFLVTIFSAIRLAKFNVDVSQSDSFKGLPTPASAILIAAISISMQQQMTSDKLLLDGAMFSPYFQIGLTLIIAFLLVSNLPIFALKFKNAGWKDNKIRYIFLVLALLLIVLFQYTGIIFAIVLYILLSLINNALKITS